MDCAFKGHSYRADICQGSATVFLKTSKGVVWPLCRACNQRHKETMAKLVHNDRLDVVMAMGVEFDIPLSDQKVRLLFQRQDPAVIRNVIAHADALVQS